MRACGRVSGLAIWLTHTAMAQQQPSPDTVLHHAIELHQAGDIQGAIAEYRAYLKQEPGNVMARSNLGAALSKAGQYEDAIGEYRQALDLEPQKPAGSRESGPGILQDLPDLRGRGRIGEGRQAATIEPAGDLPAGRLQLASG